MQSTSKYGSIPQGLPTYFSFGILSGLGQTPIYDTMRTQNGTKFDFRFQWLTGGVNTGKEDWTSWVNGTFLTKYVTESGAHGYIPVLLYYNLCQSNGPRPGTDCNTGSNDVQYTGNLKTKSLMKSYFSNWTLLMQKIGAYGKPVVVVAEPDFWGFMQGVARKQYGTNDPSSIPAEVKASGNPDAAGFPDNVQGFAWALLHMRDKYAPNARLALHVSYWSSGYDIGTNTTNIDVAAVAQTTADFINKAGIVGNPSNASTWDILTNDVSWSYLAGKSGTWWDRYNKTLPNFARYLSFISDLTQDTHRRVIMLEVPVGNQYYDTMNNTTDHYQDNRAQYIFGHISDFANAGIIAVLFGKNSSPLDAQNDGITNPAPISTYECNKCNTHVSHYSDDDGGYLRLTLGAYMKHPIALP